MPRALEAEDVGGAGRRRVEALPLQRSARLTAVAATSMTTSPGPGLGVGQVGDDEGLGAARVRSDDSAHGPTLGGRGSRGSVGVDQLDLVVAVDLDVLEVVGLRGRCRPSVSASADARPASSSTGLGVGAVQRGGVAEQVRRDRARRAARRCAPRRGRGRGPGPRRPRSRCRGRRRARRSSRAGSRVQASYAVGDRATTAAADRHPRSIRAPRTRSTTSSSASPALRASRTNVVAWSCSAALAGRARPARSCRPGAGW